MKTIDQILTEAINALGKPAADTTTAFERVSQARNALYHFGISDVPIPPNLAEPAICMVA